MRLKPKDVEQQIAARIEKLKAQAVTPTVEPVDEDEAAAEEAERREKRRADNLRRMKSPVLVQRTESGAIRFRHDLGVKDDAVRASGRADARRAAERHRDDARPFGGLSPTEAGRKSAEKRKLEQELREGDSQTQIVQALKKEALKGNAQAVRALIELNVLVPQTPETRADQGLLALLTRDQRNCIQLALRDEKISKELALEAWVR